MGEVCLAPNKNQSVSAESIQHPLAQLESQHLAGGTLRAEPAYLAQVCKA